jgi:hypothetical protein
MRRFRALNAPAAVLAVAALVVFASAAGRPGQANSPFLGDWKGSISVAGQDLEIALRFTLDENKALVGKIDIPAQNALGLPLGEVKVEARAIGFVIAGIPGNPTFNGALDQTGKKIAGAFTQSGYTGTFSVEKT